jgi:protein O-GlcNAc transferase
MTPQQIFHAAREHQQAGRLGEAESLCREMLRNNPDDPNALNLLAGLASQSGRASEAVESLTRAVSVAPTAGALHFNLGLALGALERWSEAAAACRRAADLSPKNIRAWFSAGSFLRRAGKVAESLASQDKAVELNPNSADCHCGRGLALHMLGRLEDSAAAFRHALQLKPDDYPALNNLGLVLVESGHLDEAIACFDKVLKIRPDDAAPHLNIALALFHRGDWPQAAAAYRKAAELNPTNSTIAGNFLYAMQFQPDYDATALLHENQIWNERHAAPLAPHIRPHNNDRTPDRRLRIGYVSPNFREHSQAPFILPLLRLHDRQAVEVFCYSDVVKPDAVTAKMQQCADVWRNTAAMSDEALADAVRADRIDILVDLSMHMAGNRLLCFSRKPAPVQVTWLAYPCTTGLTAIDYRLTDAFLDPPGTDAFYTEKSIRLPRTFACFDPEALQAPWPDLIAPPAQQNGHITFGSLNNFCKVNEPLLKLWSGVLHATHGSRLRLLAPAGTARERTLAVFAKFGVAPDRIEFVDGQSRALYLKELNRIDICLDTIPYNGHTTSLDAMWLGIPVVTRIGHTASGRVGISLASNLQMTDLVARSDEDFVKIASGLAGDSSRVAELRQTLRQKLADSPITDANRFAEDVQSAYRQMWRTWCESSN